MSKIKAILLKPLDADPIGAEREFAKVDFDRLEKLGAVKRAATAKQARAPRNKQSNPPANKTA